MTVLRAAESLQPFRDGSGQGAILFDPTQLRQAGPELFEPGHWGGRAHPVGARGGRGAAWFVHGEFGEAVLRHYRRGGAVARLSADRYIWHGAHRTRSFREYRLLAHLHREGLPVPAPVAARYLRTGLLYRADILVRRIPGARSLGEWLVQDPESEPEHGPELTPWEEAGRTIARFHRAGVEHADLNAHNILVDAAGAIWLIDFDRGRQRLPETGWREANLARLLRSLRKLAGPGRAAAVEPVWTRLRGAYDRAWAEQL